MNTKEDFNLRENADIVALAINAAKTLDSTELKEWFDKKYAGYSEMYKTLKEIHSFCDGNGVINQTALAKMIYEVISKAEGKQ